MLNKIADAFAISDACLQKIVSGLYAELTNGLQKNYKRLGGELHMSPSFIHCHTSPNGTALGMTIEASGKRIRISSASFDSVCSLSSSATQVFVTPKARKQSTSSFFDYIAFCIREFLQVNNLESKLCSDSSSGSSRKPQRHLPLGISIGLPVSSKNKVAEDAKEDCLDLCGSDIARRLCDTILRSHLPVRVTSVTNNTVSALIAAKYADKNTCVAASFNHGINAAYMEDIDNVESLSSPSSQSTDSPFEVAINTEIGRFGAKNTRILPLTMWDRRLDRESKHPGTRVLEKLIADQYMGEIVRNLITDFMDNQLLFSHNIEVEAISTEYAFHTAYMAPIMEDASSEFKTVEDIFAAEFGISGISLADRKVIRSLCEIVAGRASKLAGAIIAALVIKATASSSTAKRSNQMSVALSGVLFDTNVQLYENTVSSLEQCLTKHSDASVDVYLQNRCADLFGAAVNAASL
ncbi:Hexokinase-3 [Coemansia erecta]|nr:Hexokinase-3 [Coemansia erecta]